MSEKEGNNKSIGQTYDTIEGVKLKLVHPTDESAQINFDFNGIAGNIEAHLANFG